MHTTELTATQIGATYTTIDTTIVKIITKKNIIHTKIKEILTMDVMETTAYKNNRISVKTQHETRQTNKKLIAIITKIMPIKLLLNVMVTQ